MDEETGKYLPIGSVVLLKGATNKVMITGFCVVDKNKPDKMYDYSGCRYPHGIISSKRLAMFDHNQIDKIYHLGLYGEEETAFKNRLNEYLNK